MTTTHPERYVTAPELAALMGVSLRTVKKWTAEGMPSETWGIRVRRYLPSQARAWAEARADSTVGPRKHPRHRRMMDAGAQHREE